MGTSRRVKSGESIGASSGVIWGARTGRYGEWRKRVGWWRGRGQRCGHTGMHRRMEKGVRGQKGCAVAERESKER